MTCCKKGKDDQNRSRDAKPEAGGQEAAAAPMGPPMMRRMRARCAEMMGAMGSPAATAAAVPPALDEAFQAWLRQMEDKALAAVAAGEQDAGGLATSLGVDEESARYLLTRLAAEGKVAMFARPIA